MRDILTVIAGLLILVLTAALVVPPWIDWEAHRARIDLALTRAAGIDAKTDGNIEVRLLPSPRVRIAHLRLGEADAPSLDARFVRAELALMPLLRGEARFTETRIGRAEIRIPIAPGSASLASPGAALSVNRDWAFEDLRVSQLLVTAVAPATGRTDQLLAENVHLESQSLAGPWRVEGTTRGVPFRLATGEMGADRTVAVKLAGGGDTHPRFDIDAKLALPAGESPRPPSVSGTAKILFGSPAQTSSAGVPVPAAIQASFTTAGRTLELDPVSVEAGEGASALRLGGTGRLGFDDLRLALKLEGKRADVDSFLLSASGQELRARLAQSGVPEPNVPLDLDLDLDLGSIGFAQDELSNFVLRASVSNGRARVERLEFVAPGQTRVSAEGDIGVTSANGRIRFTSAASDRLLHYLAKLSLAPPLARAIEVQPLEAVADVTLSPSVLSFRNLRLKVGEASLTGNARYTAPEGPTRGRLDAQIAMQGLDLAQLPQLSSVFDATRDLDIGFTLDARGVRHGGTASGRIAARLTIDGPSLVVEALEIADLAGANARVSGRIGADGSGRIAGKVIAKRAAPLIDLWGSVWVGAVAKFVPGFLREGELDLEVAAERVAQGARYGGRLRSTARGQVAGGRLEAEVFSAEGAAESLSLRYATENAGILLERPNVAALRRPARIEIKGEGRPSAPLNLTVSGEIAGARIETVRPLALARVEETVESGELDVASPDIAPFLVVLGEGARVSPPVPLQLRLALKREGEGSAVSGSGQIADNAFKAALAVRSSSEFSGSLSVTKLSIPWIVNALVLNTAPSPRSTSLWSTARFGEASNPLRGAQLALEAKQVDLGRDQRGENGKLALSIMPDGVALRDLKLEFAGGHLTGGVAITRQGSLASVVGDAALENASLSALLGQSPFEGRVSGALRFGSSAETLAGMVTNLAGAGDVRLADVQVRDADPASVERIVPRVLAESDPLSPRRLEAVASEELSRGPLRAAAIAAPATMVGGVLRLSPIAAEAGPSAWQGAVALDFKTLALDVRGTLTAKNSPKGWTGTPPFVALSWSGPIGSARREVDVGSLTNGLAAIVLQRELDRIEAFEMEAHERARLNARRAMEQQRERDRLAAEEAARQARLREEAERQARMREQQEAERQARLREEAERQARMREQIEADRQARIRQQTVEPPGEEIPRRSPPMRPAINPPPGAPLDIRPPAALGRPPG